MREGSRNTTIPDSVYITKLITSLLTVYTKGTDMTVNQFRNGTVAALAAAVFLLAGCSKKDNAPVAPEQTPTGQTPSTPIPAEMTGTWYAGTIGFTNFYNQSTGTWNNSRGLGMFYTLNANGTFEFGWLGEFYNYECLTRGWIYRRGTVVLNDTTVVLYDNFGRARGEYTCTPRSNFDRPDPLKVRTLTVLRAHDEQGRPVLLIRGENEEFVPYKKME
jgi:hypothetical protein